MALESEIETLEPRSQDLSKMNSSALESQNLGLEITTLLTATWTRHVTQTFAARVKHVMIEIKNWHDS